MEPDPRPPLDLEWLVFDPKLRIQFPINTDVSLKYAKALEFRQQTREACGVITPLYPRHLAVLLIAVVLVGGFFVLLF